MATITFQGHGARYDNSSTLLSENFFLVFSRPEPTVIYNQPHAWEVRTNLPTGTVASITFHPASSFTPQPGETPPLGAVGSIALFDQFGNLIARFAELPPGLQVADYIANPNLLVAGNDEFTGSLENDVLNLGDGDDRGDGRDGDDILRGGAGDDVLLPDDGDDTLDGGDGFDIVEYSIFSPAMFVDLSTQTISGVEADGDTIMNIEGFVAGDGDDVLIGDDGANLLDGHTGDDYIEGLGGDDILIASRTGGANSALYGGDGDDRLVTSGSGVPGNLLEGGAGADQLVGGVGFDTASYSASDAGVTINLTTNEASGGHATGDVLSGIENLIGSAFDDVLTGDDVFGINDGNGLFGDAGNDVIVAGAGYDELYGEDGSDVLIGGADDDDLDGGDGNDQLQGDGGWDILLGGLGDDVLDGGGSVDNLFGGDGSDILSGGAFDDRLDGGAGDDRLTDDNGDNDFLGGEGNDVLVGGGPGVQIMSGDAGSDILIGGDNHDLLEGGEGDDLLAGGADDDRLFGGEGVDAADFGAAGGAVTVDLGTGSARETFQSGWITSFWEDTLTGIENVFGSAFSDVLTGDGADNLLRGGAGADTLAGGAGFDTVDYAASNAAVTVDLAMQTASGGEADGDTLSGFEKVVGSAFGDSLTGDGGANVLLGAQGDDTLAGGAGADLMEGGDGDDVFVHAAEAGADTIFGGVDGQDSGFDTITFSTAGAGVVVRMSGEAATIGGALLATFSGIELVIGSAFGDTITGIAGADRLVGGAGADWLSGGAGDDWFVQDLVGAGGDHLAGEAGFDTIDYGGANAGVTVQLAGYATHAGAIIAVFSGIEAAIGSAFNDALIGDAGNNRLIGGAGADWLVGQGGDDTFVQGIQGGAPDRLFGDAGIDTIDYGAANAAVVVQLSGYSTSGGAALATFTGIENATGTGLADVIVGNAANNRITGGDGGDWLVGGAGDDVFVQRHLGGSADRLFGDAGFDTIDYSGAVVGMTVQLSGYAVGGGATLATFTGIEGAIGTSFSDALIGTAADNHLTGGEGADWLVGGGGADAIDGGDGDDRLVMRVDAAVDALAGGAGTDVLDYSSATEGVIVQLSGYAATSGGALLATLSGIESAIGTNFGDALIGNASNNVLTGGQGGDWLVGAAGADAFVYLSVESATDTVADFSRLQGDRISLAAIDADPTDGDNDAFTFSSSRTAGVSGQAVVTNFGSSSLISLYLDADDIADTTIQIVHQPGLVMNASDFIL